MTIGQKHLIFIPLFLIVMVALTGSLVMWLWNWLLPEIFGLPTLNFWQAVGLLALCRLLVGNIGLCGHHHGHGHKNDGCDKGKNKLRERWANMTPQERQEFIERHQTDGAEQIAEDGR